METLTYLRTFKVMGMAVFDWVATLIGLYLFKYYLYPLVYPNQVFPIENNFLYVLVGVLFGIIVHLMTGTPTMLNYYLGLSSAPQ